MQGQDDIVLLEDALMHRRIEEYRHMLAAALRLCQRLVCLGEKLIDEAFLPGRRRYTDAGVNGQMLLFIDVWFIQDVSEIR